jgi:DNA-binding GntR family transcriptional regulator
VDTKRGAESARQHERLYEAIKDRDSKKATELMQSHIERATIYWGQILGGKEAPSKTRVKRTPGPRLTGTHSKRASK